MKCHPEKNHTNLCGTSCHRNAIISSFEIVVIEKSQVQLSSNGVRGMKKEIIYLNAFLEN